MATKEILCLRLNDAPATTRSCNLSHARSCILALVPTTFEFQGPIGWCPNLTGAAFILFQLCRQSSSYVLMITDAFLKMLQKLWAQRNLWKFVAACAELQQSCGSAQGVYSNGPMGCLRMARASNLVLRFENAHTKSHQLI